MLSLWNILEHDSEPIKIVDVGAMILDSNPPEYHALLKPGVSKLIGFEPNEQECRKLNESCNDDSSYLPYFIGDGSERKFNLCKYNATSSLYESNMNLLEKFQNLAELCELIETSAVSTMRLDDIDQVKGADYLKIDVQGAEVDVFNGAENLLSEIMIIHTEVEFVPIYIDQPLFAEVDHILRKNGFLFHKFFGISGRCFKPFVINENINERMSQMLWSDAIYVKSFMDFDSISPEKLFKLAVILHDVYLSYDMVYNILQHYDKQKKTEYAKQYISIFSQNAQSCVIQLV
ncbi:FkbM family methyltransferase [Planctomycetota bacterium]